MAIFKSILVFIEVITCFLLVTIILLQKAKSHGAGMAFGAAMGESLFGAQTGNVLTKATVVLTIIFLLCTTLLAVVTPKMGGSVTDTMPVRSRPAAMPQNVRSPQSPSSTMPSMPEMPSASLPASAANGGRAPVKADQPMQPDAATSLPDKPGEVPSK